jgi:hypothetical protein
MFQSRLCLITNRKAKGNIFGFGFLLTAVKFSTILLLLCLIHQKDSYMKTIQFLLVTAIFLLCLTAVGNVYAATFTVMNTNDSGPGSLRQAVLGINANNQDNTINFDPIIFSTPQTIVLTSGHLEFTDNMVDYTKTVTINGPGANLLTISANNQSRVLTIGWRDRVLLSGVKITKGKGGIFVHGGYLGEDVETLVLKDSIISENSEGGVRPAGLVRIINSTIANNTAPHFGGGVSFSSGGHVHLINSTVSGNTAGLGGGGIYSQGGDLYLTNSTIAFNRVTSVNGGGGGGIYLTDILPYIHARMTMKNSIIASNQTTASYGKDLTGNGAISEGFNIIGSTSGNSIVFLPSDQFDINPQLDTALRTNGGIIPTHALGAGSPAIDRGDNCVLKTPANGGCFTPNITTDQRGITRPQDGNNDGTATVDIGSFEATAAEIAGAPGTIDLQTSNDTGASSSDNITMSRNLSFDVNGVSNGATVEFYRNGELVGSKTGDGNAVSFTDSELPANGTFVYSARQITNNVQSLIGPVLTVIIDNTAPKATVNQAAGQSDPTNTQPINFNVIFDEEISGFEASDISLSGSTAGVSTANKTVSGSGKTYTVSVNNLSADGTVVTSILPGAVKDIAGNNNEASTSTDNSVIFDSTAPTVTINQAANQVDPSRSSTINFTVVFSESVTGFNNADILLTNSTANVSSASITVTGSGTTYNVAVNNITSNGGVLTAQVRAGAASDAASNQSAASTSSDNTVTVDNTSPTVTINQAAGQADPTNTLPINFTVVFSETVTGFDSADVSFSGSSISTTAAGISITGSGTTYNVAVSNITSNGGMLRASIRSGAATDQVGNISFASSSTDNQIIIDNVAPTVSINQSIGQSDPTSTFPINFTVVFNELVSGFDAADVSLSGSTANVDSAVVTVSGSGNVYTVSVRNVTSSGQVRATVLAGAAQDGKGNLSTASTSTDNTVTVSFRRSLFDYDGDGKSDMSVFRPGSGVWHLLQSQSGYAAPQFGLATDKLVPADYDGDGKTDIAVFRENSSDPAKAKFYILLSSNNQLREEQLGSSGDIPVAGDWDGDGKTDVGVYRAGTQANAQGYFYYRPSSRPGVNFIPYPWGIAGDKPVVADYDGDGKTDPAIFRPATGEWFVDRSRDGFYAIQFGAAEDKPVVGDYDGDGKADQAVFRPSNGVWYLWNSRNGFTAVQFGVATDVPVAADYDGDGRTDPAVYRDGNWFILNSGSGFSAFGFGASSDKPIPSSFVP